MSFINDGQGYLSTHVEPSIAKFVCEAGLVSAL